MFLVKLFLQSCQIVTFSECKTPFKLITKNNEIIIAQSQRFFNVENNFSTQEALTPKCEGAAKHKAKSDWSVHQMTHSDWCVQMSLLMYSRHFVTTYHAECAHCIKENFEKSGR